MSYGLDIKAQWFWRLSGRIGFLVFSSFQRLPSFLNSCSLLSPSERLTPPLLPLPHLFSLTLTFLPPFYKDQPHYSQIESSWLTSVKSAKSLLPCRVTFSHLLGIKRGYLWGPLFCLLQSWVVK